jgi:hypothetical protein
MIGFGVRKMCGCMTKRPSSVMVASGIFIKILVIDFYLKQKALMNQRDVGYNILQAAAIKTNS